MTAEQKWKQYDNDTYKTYVHGICDAAQQSREAYKSALRKAILENGELSGHTKQLFLQLLETTNPE